MEAEIEAEATVNRCDVYMQGLGYVYSSLEDEEVYFVEEALKQGEMSESFAQMTPSISLGWQWQEFADVI